MMTCLKQNKGLYSFTSERYTCINRYFWCFLSWLPRYYEKMSKM